MTNAIAAIPSRIEAAYNSARSSEQSLESALKEAEEKALSANKQSIELGVLQREADTDRVGVERFNDMLVRMVLSDLRGGGMHEPGPLGQQQSALEPAWRDPRGGARLLALR